MKNIFFDFSRTFFCNYFVAKKKFWLEWLELGERLFFAAENFDHILYSKLNEQTIYNSSHLPMKIFIQERLVDIILHLNNDLNIFFYSPYNMPLSNTPLNQYIFDLIVSESLKSSYISSNLDIYKSTFETNRKSIANKIIDQDYYLKKYFERIL